MDLELKSRFLTLWSRYLDGAELPITFYYTDGDAGLPLESASEAERCLIANLAKVRNGTPLRFGAESIGCQGGRRYTGFSDSLRPNFEYFLSCGIPGEMEGERYKKSPELVKAVMANAPRFRAPKQFIMFKRWDLLTPAEDPEVVTFFAPPDVLSGLFTLSGFDEVGSGVIAPFGAGCGSIVLYPYLEQESRQPRCVLGMFDPSARPYVPADALTFSIPMIKFTRMVENMEESFLTTKTWSTILKRIALHGKTI